MGILILVRQYLYTETVRLINITQVTGTERNRIFLLVS